MMDLVEVSQILQTKGGFRELYEQGVIQKLIEFYFLIKESESVDDA